MVRSDSPPQAVPSFDLQDSTALRRDMLELHGFRVTIVCDEEDLETHSPSVEGRVKTGWIASEAGKPFAIRIEQVQAGKRPRTQQRIYMNGVLVRNMMPTDPDLFLHRGMNPTPTTFAPFQFASLQTTDDAASSAPKKNDENLGVIKITLERMIQTGVALNAKTYEIPQPELVHERNKKRILGGLSIATGPVEKVSAGRSLTVKPYNPKDPSPFVTFVFKYRTREYLQAEGIIPQPAAAGKKRRHESSPSRTPEAPDEEDVKPSTRVCVDVEEHDARRKRLRQLKDELRNLEASLAEDLGQPPPDIKREPFPFAVGQVVDLTGPDRPAPRRRGTVKLEEPPAEIRVGRAAGTVIDLTDD